MKESVKKIVVREGRVILGFVLAWLLLLLIEVTIFGIEVKHGSYTISVTFICYGGYLLYRFIACKRKGEKEV